MTTGKDLKDIRREYIAERIHRADMKADPFDQFGLWYDQAAKIDPLDASSMALATATREGCPSVRIVLLKHYDKNGFCWYTDYRSHKGQEIAENPQAEVLFYWRGLERQIRIWGKVEQLPRSDAESYFAERPLGSQLSAAASAQSSMVESRQQLEARADALAQKYENCPIPCPESWGGYRLVPERFEFWQGRENRLHDRLIYSQQLDQWQLVRLAP
ncbi:pyridoxamine 5'-phosphate oxidase [Motiliproteus sp. MSK22-1]|uniref:pyridoxamine 5'-phosphate oxidase n=1 Tax=Motiliproteus sp. MSK22-1 TaxID=1897630 RepID=UPI0009756FD8|nr:pyridoxamine 5'-phosphate oxidase [Motiliproteus sp. MSK22-1]OMH25705.1 pyridoxamine 5'-phosphate oxidase [Motiliproteus sp. MSK22-1]